MLSEDFSKSPCCVVAENRAHLEQRDGAVVITIGNKEVGKSGGSERVAVIGARPQSHQIAPIGQQVGQFKAGPGIAVIGADPQPLLITLLGQQVGQLMADLLPGAFLGAQYLDRSIEVAACDEKMNKQAGGVCVPSVS